MRTETDRETDTDTERDRETKTERERERHPPRHPLRIENARNWSNCSSYLECETG